MPQYNRRELDVKAHEYGFNRDTFEKNALKNMHGYLEA